MKTVSKASMFAFALLLGACSHYSEDLSSLDGAMKTNTTVAYAASPQDIAPAAGGPATGSLNTFLARDYYELARFENDKAFDYKAASQYTDKAMMASKGQLTPPSKISSFDLPTERVGELTQARANLIAALKTQNTPENGANLAKAQSSFDCWIERAEEAEDDAHFAECKGQFEQSMASLTAPAAGDANAATVYQLGFLETSAVPDEATNKRIEYIAQTLQAPENTPLGIALSAPAGEIGNARINTVRNALIAKGVPETRITLTTPEAVPATVPPTETVNGGVQATIIGSTVSSTTTTTQTYVPVTPQVVPTTQPAVAPSAGQ